MIKLVEIKEGKEKNVEVFLTVADTINYLNKNDFFSWILDNEPERELPDFNKVETLEELEAIFDEYDYSWWRMSAEEVETEWLDNFGDYDLKRYKNYIHVVFHENVNRQDRIVYLTDKELKHFLFVIDEYENSDDTDEQESIVSYINDLYLHI